MAQMVSASDDSRVLVFLHTVVAYIWIILATAVLSSLTILVSFFPNSGNAMHAVARTWGRCILWAGRTKVHVRGMENIRPSESVIFMSNHQSNFDIPVFFSALPVRFRWLAKAELFKIPIFGRAMRAAGYISIDRSDGKSALRSLKRAAQSIRTGSSVLIFPEGTRSRDNDVRPGKPGIGFLMDKTDYPPVLPVRIWTGKKGKRRYFNILYGGAFCINRSLFESLDETARFKALGKAVTSIIGGMEWRS